MGFSEKYDGERKERKKRRKERKKEGGKKQKKKRKLSVLAIMLLALLLAIILFFGIVFLRINVIDSGDQSRIDRHSEWFEKSEYDGNGQRLTSKDVKLYNSGDTIFDKNVTNILLIGQDRRKGEGRTRSDTMIVMSINSETNEITLVSLMRDMYVMIPGYSNNKMNAAYAFGGMELIDATIERNFGIKIDGNVEVDFDGFEDVISQLGGVDIEMTEAEAEMMNGYGFGTVFKKGKNHMNSEEALMYVRNRSMGGYDYNRTERQRKLIMAVYQDMKHQDVSKSIAMVNTLLNYVTTDINPVRAIQYAIPILNSLKDSEIHSKRIPVDGTFYDANVDGMAVLVPDLLWNRIYLKNYLYGMPLENTESVKFSILKKLYDSNPKAFKRYDGYMRCTLDMKAYGLL